MDEFKNTPLAEQERRSSLTVFVVALGLTAVSTNFIIGAVLAEALNPKEWTAAIIGGGIILAAIAAHTSYYSSKEGSSFAGQMRVLLGPTLARFVVLLAAAIILGWYTIQASLLASVIAQTAPFSGIDARLWLLIVPLALASTSFFGIRALSALSWFSLPIVFFGVVYVLVFAPTPLANDQSLNTSSMPFAVALSMVFTLWVMGATATIADITRFNKSPSKAAAIGFSAFLIGNTTLMLSGALAYERFGNGDFSSLLAAAGLGLVGLSFLIANIWSTNDNAMYSISLNGSLAFGLSPRFVIALAAIFAAIASLTRPYESPQISSWLSVLGSFVPSVAGTIVGARLFMAQPRPRICLIAIGVGTSVAIINWAQIGAFSSMAVSFTIVAIGALLMRK